MNFMVDRLALLFNNTTFLFALLSISNEMKVMFRLKAMIMTTQQRGLTIAREEKECVPLVMAICQPCLENEEKVENNSILTDVVNFDVIHLTTFRIAISDKIQCQ